MLYLQQANVTFLVISSKIFMNVIAMRVRKFNNIYANVIFKNVEKYRKLRGFSQPDLCGELALLGVNMYNKDIYRIEHNKKE